LSAPKQILLGRAAKSMRRLTLMNIRSFNSVIVNHLYSRKVVIVCMQRIHLQEKDHFTSFFSSRNRWSMCTSEARNISKAEKSWSFPDIYLENVYKTWLECNYVSGICIAFCSSTFLLLQKETHFISGNFVGKFPKLIQSSKFHLLGLQFTTHFSSS
jgi:hypothetical protein